MADETEAEEKRDADTMKGQPFLTAKIDKIKPLIEDNGEVHKLEEKIQTAAGSLSKVYERIVKDYHGNAKAVKLCRSLAVMSTDKAYDFMRTFVPLAKSMGLYPEDDLVDMAGGDDKPPAGGKKKVLDDGVKPVSTADQAPKSDRVIPITTGKTAIDRARENLAGGKKPDAPKGPPGDTDLALDGVEGFDENVEARIAEQRAIDGADFDKMETTGKATVQ